MNKTNRLFIFIVVLTVVATIIALPKYFSLNVDVFGLKINQAVFVPKPSIDLPGRRDLITNLPLKKGLDIQGGMQVVLQAHMEETNPDDRDLALEAAKNIILKRVDYYGIAEPVAQTSRAGEDDYRIIVELPGVDNPDQALELVGKTAQLDFRLQEVDTSAFEANASTDATPSAYNLVTTYKKTDLTGKQLKRASAQTDPNTNEPVVALEFNEEGRKLFADITKEHTGEVLAIFIDNISIAEPVINTPIFDGRAIMTGSFTEERAQELAIQFNAGALPVSISVLEQRSIGASLGETSVQKSVRAGVLGLSLVMLFMILYYGWKGVIANIALLIYASLTVAIYKIMGITLTLPGIAGLLLTIGMAVDANILIFERMKEELRVGQPLGRAMELGFGRAWDSIKDANLATIITALILINPLNLRFLNSSGLVRGFGITLLVGVLVSLFTGVVVTRTLMRLFLPVIVGGSNTTARKITKKG